MPYVSDNDPIPQPTRAHIEIATILPAEGARVALVSCDECGAAILLDPRDDTDPRERHRAWHETHR